MRSWILKQGKREQLEGRLGEETIKLKENLKKQKKNNSIWNKFQWEGETQKQGKDMSSVQKKCP